MESTLNTLPNEILVEIYKYIPLEDKIFTMPYVSKIWHNISEEKKSIKLFARQLLKKRIERHNYNDDQVKTIVSLAKNNDLISELKEKKYKCDVGKPSAVRRVKFEDKKNPIKQKIINFESDNWYSEYFNINWNCFNSTLSITDESLYTDLSYLFTVQLDRRKSGCSYRLNKTFGSFSFYKLSAYSGNDIKKIDIDSGKEISKPTNEERVLFNLIEDALTLRLNFDSMWLAYKNVITLSQMGFKKFEDIESTLSFNCDENGLIIAPENSTGIYLNLKKEVIDNEISVVTWNLGDDIELESKDRDIMDFFRLSVFSDTVQKLNEKMGTLIKQP